MPEDWKIPAILAIGLGGCAAALGTMAVGGGAAGYRTMRKMWRHSTRDHFEGRAYRHYSSDKVLDGLLDVFQSIQPEQFRDVYTTLCRIGREANHELTPYELMDRTKKELVK